jgi:hypothetical protein
LDNGRVSVCRQTRKAPLKKPLGCLIEIAFGSYPAAFEHLQQQLAGILR